MANCEKLGLELVFQFNNGKKHTIHLRADLPKREKDVTKAEFINSAQENFLTTITHSKAKGYAIIGDPWTVDGKLEPGLSVNMDSVDFVYATMYYRNPDKERMVDVNEKIDDMIEEAAEQQEIAEAKAEK